MSLNWLEQCGDTGTQAKGSPARRSDLNTDGEPGVIPFIRAGWTNRFRSVGQPGAAWHTLNEFGTY